MSRRTAGRLWAHNDSGAPVLFALDTKGAVAGRVELTGAQIEDWEAVAVGPCPAGSCVYVGDIGDNDAGRKRITVYRFPEPDAGVDSVAVKETFHATYPDGAHDAETLLVTSSGDLFIVTKGDKGPIGVYRFPQLRPGQTHQLERVGEPRQADKTSEGDRVTDGAVSADGLWIVLRTARRLAFHRAAELTAGTWREVRTVNLDALREPQGEGVAMGTDGSVYLAGEGGGKKQPGSFARLTCTSG